MKVGPDLTWNGGYRDAFVAKLEASGRDPRLLRLHRRRGQRQRPGIAVDGAGNAYVSADRLIRGDIPRDGKGRTSPRTASADAFVAKVNPAGTDLVYCGYVGENTRRSRARGSPSTAMGSYIAGTTFSRGPSFPVLVGPDLTANGAYPNDEEAFVAKLSAFSIPAPSASSISPAGITAGDPALTVSVGGTAFESGAVVMWDGRDLPTTFVSAGELSAEVGADLLLADGIVSVAVRNPNGGVSNTVVFTVNNPAPALTLLSPVQTTVGGSRFVLT